MLHVSHPVRLYQGCLLYTSDAADECRSVDLGGRRIIKKKFFQAEDGIRDALQSRGLGDVYKRQGIHTHTHTRTHEHLPALDWGEWSGERSPYSTRDETLPENGKLSTDV